MIVENKNKLKLKTTPVVEQTRLPDGQGSLRGKASKILVLGFMLLIVGVGFFISAGEGAGRIKYLKMLTT